MTGEPDRGNATMDKVAGNVKSFVGGVIGNDDMKRDGDEQKSKGDATYSAAQQADKAESVKDDVKGKAQEHVGGLFSDEQKSKGQANQASADLKNEKSKH